MSYKVTPSYPQRASYGANVLHWTLESANYDAAALEENIAFDEYIRTTGPAAVEALAAYNACNRIRKQAFDRYMASLTIGDVNAR